MSLAIIIYLIALLSPAILEFRIGTRKTLALMVSIGIGGLLLLLLTPIGAGTFIQVSAVNQFLNQRPIYQYIGLLLTVVVTLFIGTAIWVESGSIIQRLHRAYETTFLDVSWSYLGVMMSLAMASGLIPAGAQVMSSGGSDGLPLMTVIGALIIVPFSFITYKLISR